MAGTAKVVSYSSYSPIEKAEIYGVGWGQHGFLRLGRASWNFKRDEIALTATYRNLEEEQSWELGRLPATISDDDILVWIANQGDSHSAADWVRIDDRILAFTFDRADA